MSNKKPKIFRLENKKPSHEINNASDELKELTGLLQRKKYEEILTRITTTKQKYPDKFLFYTLEAVTYSLLGKSEIALELLKHASVKFPGEYEIAYQLGRIHKELGDYNNALESIKISLDLTPLDYIEARSECYNEMGIIYWKMLDKENALENWKFALMENPKNREAEYNLREFSNEYDEPKAVDKIMDDLFHFQKVQVDKYLKNNGVKEFSNQAELERVINNVMSTWNNEIAPQKIKLDNLTAVEKTKWFKSIKIDFKKNNPTQIMTNLPDEKISEVINDFNEDEQTMMPFTLFLLVAKGITIERFDELFIKNSKLTEHELEIIDWALVIVDILFQSQSKKITKAEYEKIMEEAFEIAQDKLDYKKAEKAIEDTLFSIKEAISEAISEEKKQNRRKKKK